MTIMKRPMQTLAVLLLMTLAAPAAWTQDARYPPLSAYMMQRDAEVSLARSAAPASVSDRATIKVLTTSGYQTAREGDNGFVCMVLRAWSAPTYTPAQLRELVYDATVRAPICFNQEAARTVVPYYELRSKLGMERKTPTRSPLLSRRRTPKGNCQKEMGSLSLTCGLQTSSWDRADTGIRT